MLKMITKKVDPKIKVLLFLVNEPKNDVMKDFSVSLRPISFSEAIKLINDGNNKNVTKNETINPKVIIQPKSIIGLMPLNTKDRNAHIVVSTV
jgi:hypothetical protein